MLIISTWAVPVHAQANEPGAPSDGTPTAIVPLRDLWGAVVDFGRDGWAVASSPSRLDRGGALQVAGVLGATAIVFAFDEDINERTVNDDRTGLDRLLFEVGDFLEPVGFQGNTNVLYAGAAVLGYATGQDWLQRPAKQILYAHWIGSLGRQATGLLLGRTRPDQHESAYNFDPGHGTSLPSGHAAVVFELAYVLSHHIDWRPASVGLYALAGTVAYQRFASNKHWASDAVLGAAWGYAVARIVVATEERNRLRLRPVNGGGTGPGLALEMSFRSAPWEAWK